MTQPNQANSNSTHQNDHDHYNSHDYNSHDHNGRDHYSDRGHDAYGGSWEHHDNGEHHDQGGQDCPPGGSAGGGSTGSGSTGSGSTGSGSTGSGSTGSGDGGGSSAGDGGGAGGSGSGGGSTAGGSGDGGGSTAGGGGSTAGGSGDGGGGSTAGGGDGGTGAGSGGDGSSGGLGLGQTIVHTVNTVVGATDGGDTLGSILGDNGGNSGGGNGGDDGSGGGITIGAGPSNGSPIVNAGVLTSADSQSPIGIQVGDGQNIADASLLPNGNALGGTNGNGNGNSSGHLITGSAGESGGTQIADAGLLTNADSQSPAGIEVGNGQNLANASVLSHGDALSFPDMGGAGSDALTGLTPGVLTIGQADGSSDAGCSTTVSDHSLIDVNTDGSQFVQTHDNASSTIGVNNHAIV